MLETKQLPSRQKIDSLPRHKVSDRCMRVCSFIFALIAISLPSPGFAQVGHSGFERVALEIDRIVASDPRLARARVDGIAYFMINEAGAITRGPLVETAGTPHIARQRLQDAFRRAIIKAAPFGPATHELLGKVLVLRFSTCGARPRAWCGAASEIKPPEETRRWLSAN